jgi:outer membrane protein assembly factor BamB
MRIQKMKSTTFFSVVLVMGLASADMAFAADSPQFRGPNRDGIYTDTGLLKAWPEGGPSRAWMASGLGEGYASVSVVDDTIFIPGMVERDTGVLIALDLDGNERWRVTYGRETLDKQAPGARSTPTIDGDRIYLMSGLGVLSCLSAQNGDIKWQVDVLNRFGGENIEWSLAESILVDGDRVICTPGGPDASVVALDKMSGATVWTSRGLSDPASYCSPTIVERGGRRILLTMTKLYVVGIDADSGEVLWTHEHKTKYDIHAVTPVYADGMIYYTAGYRSGGGMLALSADGTGVTPKWSDKNLDCQHHGVVLLDGNIYGTPHQAGREMLCLNLESGEVVWRTYEISQGATVYADGMLYVYEGPKKGIVSLVKATPGSYERTGTFTITEGSAKHWAHPTIAGGRMYIRRGDLLFAYDIAAG